MKRKTGPRMNITIAGALYRRIAADVKREAAKARIGSKPPWMCGQGDCDNVAAMWRVNGGGENGYPICRSCGRGEYEVDAETVGELKKDMAHSGSKFRRAKDGKWTERWTDVVPLKGSPIDLGWDDEIAALVWGKIQSG